MSEQEITVSEARHEIARAENQIYMILAEFEQKTGFCVKEVILTSVQRTNGEAFIGSVKVNAEIRGSWR